MVGGIFFGKKWEKGTSRRRNGEGKMDICTRAINMEATGMNISRLRKAAGITVRELQEIFGFGSPQAIYKWQHGLTLPTIDNLVILAVVFGVSIDDIIVLY